MSNVRSPDVCGKSFYEQHEEQAHKYIVAAPIMSINVCFSRMLETERSRSQREFKMSINVCLSEMLETEMSRSQRRFKMSVNVCLSRMLETSLIFVAEVEIHESLSCPAMPGIVRCQDDVHAWR